MWSNYYGGQGRIRTSVARKERQIYSLLPLTTRPPVRALRSARFSITWARENVFCVNFVSIETAEWTPQSPQGRSTHLADVAPDRLFDFEILSRIPARGRSGI